MENFLKLFDFQKVDMELYNLEMKIEKSECKTKAQKAKETLLKGQKTAQQLEKDIENEKNKIEEIISNYDAINIKVEEIVKECKEVEDPDEAKALKKKAEELNSTLKKTQASIIGGLNNVKDTQKKYHDLMLELQKAKKVYVENKELHAKEIEDSKDDIAKLKKDVAKLEKGLDKDLYETYKKKKKNGMPVIAQVSDKDKQCLGCFMELPSSVYEKGKAKEEIIECENCGKLLLFD